jgi:hypothetical protein
MPPIRKRNKKTLVMKALDNPKYTWRTVRGIAEETGLDARAVENVIAASEGAIVQSKLPSRDGEALFTPRSKLGALVIEALENPRRTWRTLLSIAVETGLDIPTVEAVIASCGDQVIQSEVPSEEGDDLYTTRSHLLEKAR